MSEARAATDLRGGLFWIALGLAVLIASWRMDRFESMGGTIFTAPGLVPGLFGCALLMLGALLCLRAWPHWRRAHAARADPLFNRRIVVTLALTLVYAAVLIGRIPFMLATAGFVTIFAALHSDAPTALRRWGVALAAGVATAAAVVLVFEQLFFVRLP